MSESGIEFKLIIEFLNAVKVLKTDCGESEKYTLRAFSSISSYY